MSELRLDHVAIGAARLEEGDDYCRVRLGLSLPPGGKHPLMGTHNRLSATGDDSFLEVIGVDPDAARPDHPRWFALDAPWQARRLTERPRPIAWVVRVDDLDARLAAAKAAGIDLGEPMQLSRDDLTWRITVRSDGELAENGLLPLLIEWPNGTHPAARMPDQGLRYHHLTLRHPQPERLREQLAALGLGNLADVEHGLDEAICVELRTPDGALALLD